MKQKPVKTNFYYLKTFMRLYEPSFVKEMNFSFKNK